MTSPCRILSRCLSGLTHAFSRLLTRSNSLVRSHPSTIVFLAVGGVLLMEGVMAQPIATDSGDASVTLKEDQLGAIKIETIGTHPFATEREAVATVAYQEVKATEASAGTASAATFKILVVNVTESDIPLLKVDQPVRAHLFAYPDLTFEGHVIALGGSVYDAGGKPAIDPNTRRVTVRCEVNDEKNQLYPGMLGSVKIQVLAPKDDLAIPMNGVVRNGDGSLAVWVTKDRKTFTQRIVKIGFQQEGMDQILEGLSTGEEVVTDGAVFISNILYAPPAD